MALPHAKSGDVVDIRPLGPALAQAGTITLLKTATLEIIRLVIPAGKRIHEHQVHGEIMIQCLEGRVALTASDTMRELGAGQMLYLAGDAPHSLEGIEDASVLLTILLQKASDPHAHKA